MNQMNEIYKYDFTMVLYFLLNKQYVYENIARSIDSLQ